MKRKFTFVAATLTLLAILIAPLGMRGQTRAEQLVYTLSGTTTGGNNAYADYSDITQNGRSWKAKANTTMNPWRLGGKSITNAERDIYSTSYFSDDISKVVVTTGTTSGSITINSVKLIVSSNSSFSDATTQSKNWAASSTITFERPANTDWSNKYFKIIYNVTVSGSNNKYAEFKKAEFYKQTTTTYSITASANPTTGGSVSGAGSYESGASCTLTATANTGYTFTNWTKNGTVVSTNASYTFNVTAAGAYVANFTPNSYTINASANPTDGGSVTGAGTYNYGTSCTLVATPATGYAFLNWTKGGNVVSTNAQYTFTVSETAAYVANFASACTITATANPTAGGTVTGAGTYASGSSCTLTATAATGYTFSNWTKNGAVVSTNASYTFTVSETAAYVANFAIKTYTVTYNSNGASSGNAPTDSNSPYNHGTQVTVLDNTGHLAKSGYYFAGWNTAANGSGTSYDAGATFNITANTTLYAQWATYCNYLAFSSLGYTNGHSVDGTTIQIGDDKSISFSQGTSTVTPKYYSDGSAIRVYWGNTFTISSSSNSITSINLTFGTSDGSNEITVNTGTYSNGSWTGEANSVTFTVGGSSGNRRLAAIEVCTTPACPVPANLAVDNNSITGNSASVSWTGDAESYNLRYRTYIAGEATTATEGFEHNGNMPDGWTMLDLGDGNNTDELGVNTTANQNGNYGFRFSSFSGSSSGSFEQYLISPELNITALTFAYRTSSNSTETFYVGYSTTTNDVSAFTWSNAINTSSQIWTTYTANDIPENAKYFAIKYTSVYKYRLYIDDITYTYTPITYGAWVNQTDVTSPVSLTNLTTGTNYEVQVQSICEEDAASRWSVTTFTTLSGYTLSTSVTPQVGGTISANGTTISGDVTYAPDTELVLTAEAATGYTFQTWYIDDSPYQGNPANVTMDQNHTVAANFTINIHSYSATAMPEEGGVIRLNGGEPENYIWGQDDYGTQLSFEAIANEGYHFVNWTEDGVLTDQATYAFTLEDNRSLGANFALNSYAVTIEANPSQGGTVSGDASGNYNHGATVTVTATPSTGYHFVNWTVDGTEVSTNATLSGYAITSACTISANFVIDSYAVTIEANPAVGGAVSGYASGNYDYGTTITVTATANPGYHFVNWTVDGTEEGTSTTLSYVITSACTVSANFEPDTFEISASVAPENSGSVEGAGTYDYNSTCTLTATPNVGYTFVNWTKNGVGVSNSATYSFTVTADASYVANFQRNSYNITVAAMPSNGGTATGGGTFNHGVSVTVNATPNMGYQFVNWTVNGNVVSTSASYTFTATEALNLVANFLYAVVPPTVATNSQVTNVTGSSAQCGGQITSTGYGYISAYGFCWNTTGEPTIQDSHYQVGISTTDPFTYNITGLNANTLYYVRAYATNQEGTAYGNEVTFATMAQVTTAAVTAHTLDAIMGGSWVSGSGDATVTACGVEYKEATASTWQTATMSVPASGTSFSGTVSGLTANTNYVVRAYVTNDGGTSYGAEMPFTTIGYFAVSATVNPAESGTVSFDPEGDGQGSAAKTVTIGTDNNNKKTSFLPIYASNASFTNSFAEMIYLASEMEAGNITSISFHYYPSQGTLNHNIDIYLTHTAQNAFASDSFIPVTADDLYYSGTIIANNTNQWITLELSKPFAYNGEDNLVVGVDYNGVNGVTGDTRYWLFTETTDITCLCHFQASDIVPTDNPNVGSTIWRNADPYLKQRPNIRFTIEAAGANTQWYSWGSTPELTATPATGYQFLNWTENGVAVSTDNPYTLESIEADRNLVANFAICKTFTNAYGDHDWDNAANWAPASVPNGEDVVIAAAATITDGTVATVNNISINGGSITIEDGGQLKHNNSGVTVTTQKSITGYGSANANTNMGYYLISSPVNNIAISDVTGLQTTQYDLYKFVSNNEESGELLEWVHVNGNLEAKTGYIYASEETTTLGITGTVAHSATDIEKTLTYNNGYRFGGWNLVGNPFVCDAYVTRSSNEMNYYVLNHEAGYDEFTTASSTDPIAPMGGLMVQATAASQTITYSRTAPSKGSSILNMDVRKTLERGIATLDRARVRFGEGTNLEKFQFDTRHTKISIPEGSNEYSVYYADGAGTIPVNFKAQDNGRYTLDFSTEEVGFSYLHLIDNMNGNDVDLLQTPHYTFDAKSTDFASRFTLVFATGNDNDDTFAFFNNGVWIINNDGEATLQVVDALGRVLSSETISGSTSKAINVAPGVYMLRLINGNDVKVQKIVVRR